MHKTKSSTAPSLTTLQPNAAGADIGAREINVAMPPDRSTPAVRCFGTFTDQLRALVAWLRECRIGTVAMEAIKQPPASRQSSDQTPSQSPKPRLPTR